MKKFEEMNRDEKLEYLKGIPDSILDRVVKTTQKKEKDEKVSQLSKVWDEKKDEFITEVHKVISKVFPKHLDIMEEKLLPSIHKISFKSGGNGTRTPSRGLKMGDENGVYTPNQLRKLFLPKGHSMSPERIQTLGNKEWGFKGTLDLHDPDMVMTEGLKEIDPSTIKGISKLVSDYQKTDHFKKNNSPKVSK